MTVPNGPDEVTTEGLPEGTTGDGDIVGLTDDLAAALAAAEINVDIDEPTDAAEPSEEREQQIPESVGAPAALAPEPDAGSEPEPEPEVDSDKEHDPEPDAKPADEAIPAGTVEAEPTEDHTESDEETGLETDPGPEDGAAAAMAAAFVLPESKNAVATWPFLVYAGAWLAGAGAAVYLLYPTAKGAAVYDTAVYPWTIVGGLTLLGAGIVLIPVVWAASRGREGTTAGALFFSALLKGSVATLFGVVTWWLALVILDQLRLGSLF